MHPRWSSDHPGPSLSARLSEKGSACTARQDFFEQPLPDLELQLAAELGGASWAMVAFAPADAAWCDWLYRNLNGYAVPAELVDRVTADGIPRPACLSIFPDRRDPAFKEQLPQALAGSTYLIVVCSAHSAAEAVEEQIRTFKKKGGEDRILALVVDGPPDAQLGARPRAAQCDWLPSWLRWRLEESGFRVADRNEPRVLDARRGYRSLKQVRDSLLVALLDMDAAEFDQLGGFARDVELVALPEPPQEFEPPKPGKEPAMTTAVVSESSTVAAPRGSSKFMIGLAVVLIVVAAVFGTKSFLDITADEPVSKLNVGPVTGVLAGHSERTSAASDAPPNAAETTSVPEPAPPTVEPQDNSSPVEPAPPVKTLAGISPSNVPQFAPVALQGTSNIRSARDVVASSVPPPSTSLSVITPPAAQARPETPNPDVSPESDTVLLDEVHTLERRGDELMAQKRTEDALDLYHTGLLSAEEYAARKGANPNARDQVVKLLKKLGTLELQNSSTAEARASYLQARKNLLQFKSQGQWSRERAKALDEIESRILSLPKD
jgi:hypothetical protein